jgi:hypothetical protein
VGPTAACFTGYQPQAYSRRAGPAAPRQKFSFPPWANQPTNQPNQSRPPWDADTGPGLHPPGQTGPTRQEDRWPRVSNPFEKKSPPRANGRLSPFSLPPTQPNPTQSNPSPTDRAHPSRIDRSIPPPPPLLFPLSDPSSFPPPQIRTPPFLPPTRPPPHRPPTRRHDRRDPSQPPASHRQFSSPPPPPPPPPRCRRRRAGFRGLPRGRHAVRWKRRQGAAPRRILPPSPRRLPPRPGRR